jgi:F-type H+-transporting ATPase subunit gamma
MQSVASMRLRRYQKQNLALLHYKQVLTKNLTSILSSEQINPHSFEVADAKQKTLVILVAPTRGFCGGLHRKIVVDTYQNLAQEINQISFIAINKPSKRGISRLGGEILAFYPGPFKELSIHKIMSISELVKQLWLKGEYNKILIANAEPTNSLMGKTCLKQILPFEAQVENSNPISCELDKETFISEFLEQWLEMEIHIAMLNTQTAEEGARTVAMSGANTNANKLRQKLKLSYAKQRQAKITQEVSEIIGGSF